MPEQRKREVAYKMRIGDILSGTPIVEDIPQEATSEGESTSNAQGQSQTVRERFRFLEIGEKRIIRVNVIANIVDKYVSEGEKHWATLTIDDATGQIRLKVFGDDISKFDEINQGDTILVIGVLRSFNQELYIIPEIIKKYDPRYLFVRKLEIEKSLKLETKNQSASTPEQKLETRDQIIEIIKSNQDSNGASTEDIILKIKSAPPELIHSEIIKLIEDGIVYEPRPGRVRWLG
jgi:RPA family protein